MRLHSTIEKNQFNANCEWSVFRCECIRGISQIEFQRRLAWKKNNNQKNCPAVLLYSERDSES